MPAGTIPGRRHSMLHFKKRLAVDITGATVVIRTTGPNITALIVTTIAAAPRIPDAARSTHPGGIPPPTTNPSIKPARKAKATGTAGRYWLTATMGRHYRFSAAKPGRTLTRACLKPVT